MFSFGKKEADIDTAPMIRRLVDLTTPNQSMTEDVRKERRYNRCIPVVISDWDPKQGPTTDHIGLGFTTDLSDHGFGVLTQHRPKTADNVISFYLPQDMTAPLYFITVLTTYRKQPGGFHKLGYRVTGCMDNDSGKKYKMDEIVTELLSVQS